MTSEATTSTSTTSTRVNLPDRVDEHMVTAASLDVLPPPDVIDPASTLSGENSHLPAASNIDRTAADHVPDHNDDDDADQTAGAGAVAGQSAAAVASSIH